MGWALVHSDSYPYCQGEFGDRRALWGTPCEEEGRGGGCSRNQGTLQIASKPLEARGEA